MKKISLLLLLSVSIFAAEMDMMDDIFELNFEELQDFKVTSASKTAQSLNEVPANMIIIPRESIEKAGYRSLAELLQDLPGFSELKFADSGVHNQIGIRGVMGTNYFKILRDGVKINQTDGENISVSMGFPLFGLERVEILYGAASVLYGADAFSGVINLVSSTKDENQFEVELGENGFSYYNVHTGIKLGKDGFFIARGHLHTDEDYDLDKHYPDYFYKEDLKTFGGTIIQAANARSFDYKPNETKSLSLRYTNKGLDIGGNYIYSSDSTLTSMNNEKSIENLYDEDSNLETQMMGAYIKYSGDFYGFNSTTTLSYDTTELLIQSYFINQYTDYKPAYKYSKSQRIALEETIVKTIANHSIVFGFRYEDFSSTPMTGDLTTPSLSGSVYAGSDIPIQIFDAEWQTYALYIQDQITLNDEFQLSIAGRYDISTAYENSFIPRLALIYNEGKLSSKLIYSQAFLAPSNYRKYKMYGNPLKTNDLVGDSNQYKTKKYRVQNEDLEPEKSKSLEYNIQYKLQKNMLIKSSIYYTMIDDFIVDGQEAPAGSYIPNTTVINAHQAANAGSANTYGFDVDMIGRNYFTGFDIEYWLNYTYSNGELTRKNEDGVKVETALPYISENMVKGGITYANNGLIITPSVRYFSDISTGHIIDGTNKLDKVDAYIICDLYLSYTFAKNYKFAFRVKNLFDKKYDGVRYTDSSKYVSPQTARHMSIAFTSKF